MGAPARLLPTGEAARTALATPREVDLLDAATSWAAQHGLRWEPVIASIVLLLIAMFGVLAVHRVVQRVLLDMQPRFGFSYESIALVTRTVGGVLWFVIALLLLGSWGVSVSGVWTFLVGAITLIGVAFIVVWAMVSNITASVFLAIWRPFRLGETVEILPESVKGRVVDRNLMFTVLREEAGTVLQVPNNLFFQKMFRVSEAESQYIFEALENQRRHTPQAPTPQASRTGPG